MTIIGNENNNNYNNNHNNNNYNNDSLKNKNINQYNITYCNSNGNITSFIENNKYPYINDVGIFSCCRFVALLGLSVVRRCCYSLLRARPVYRGCYHAAVGSKWRYYAICFFTLLIRGTGCNCNMLSKGGQPVRTMQTGPEHH